MHGYFVVGGVEGSDVAGVGERHAHEPGGAMDGDGDNREAGGEDDEDSRLRPRASYRNAEKKWGLTMVRHFLVLQQKQPMSPF